MENRSFYIDLVKKIGFRKGDTVLFAADFVNLLIYFKNRKYSFNSNIFLDAIIEVLGHNGNLLLPTHNWDYCETKKYDYYKTKSMTGSLGKTALKRNDFSRSNNPIFSFAISGKSKDIYINSKHKSCFGKNSPFDLMYENSAKHISLNLDYKDSGFTFVHYIEEKVGVDYRFFKNFNGVYVNKYGLEENIKYKFYVRDRSKALRTSIKKETDNHLKSINALKNISLDFGFSTVIDLRKATDYLVKNIKDNSEEDRLIFPMISGKFTRKSISNFEYNS